MASDAPVSLRSATGVAARAPRRALPSVRFATVTQKARSTVHLWFSQRQDNGQCVALFFKKSPYDLPGVPDVFSSSVLVYAHWVEGGRVGFRQKGNHELHCLRRPAIQVVTDVKLTA